MQITKIDSEGFAKYMKKYWQFCFDLQEESGLPATTISLMLVTCAFASQRSIAKRLDFDKAKAHEAIMISAVQGWENFDGLGFDFDEKKFYQN